MFTCTIAQLVTHLVARLAVADRLSLEQLWACAAEKSPTAALDNLQKAVAWRALMAQELTALLTVCNGDTPVQNAASLAYDELLALGSESQIALCPTEQCQFQYLTNTRNYHTLKSNLGDLPFQLLVVIARHGAAGVLNPDLARESGQDARSIRLRLQKLEAAGLIVSKNVYVNKKHTTHSVHVNFVEASILVHEAKEDDLDTTRDVSRLKTLIMAALKTAHNQLRGFSDLKKEMKLDGSHSASKFFRSVCLKLHQNGYIEKLHVELPETKQRVYAIRFVKDLPSDAPDANEIGDLDAEKETFGDSDPEDEPAAAPTLPTFNLVFPPFHQIFQQIHASGENGITSGEIAKNLMGVSDYRPYTRLYEQLPTYLSNSKTLKPFKKYAEPYDDYAVSKLYDNEGKLKFYRYFAKAFCKEESPAPKPYNFAPKTANESIVTLNKKLHSSIGKTSNESLIEKKRRMVQVSDLQPAKKPRQAPKPKQPEAEIIPRARRRTAPTSFVGGDEMHVDRDSENEYDPQIESEFQSVKQEDSLSANDLPAFVTKPKSDRKRKPNAPVQKAEGSLKSITRRNHLLDLIKEDGGATFRSASLCRKIDTRMNNITLTDTKTLSRDIAFLVETNVIDVEKVTLKFDEKSVDKKILVLTDPDFAPTKERIEELKASYAESHSKKNMKIFEKRVIQSDMKLYVESPSAKKASTKTRKKRGKNRLQALADNDDDSVPPESESPVKSGDTDVFSTLKGSRRARKIQQPQATETLPPGTKRPRRNIKLEKSDVTTVYRAVVISKAFFREAIDFDTIAELVGDLDGKLVKQKWGTLRRSFGGAEAVSKGVETFQNMVLQGIEDGIIQESHLLEGDLGFFLEFWRQFDASTELTVLDEMPLYSTYEQNERSYTLTKGFIENQSSLWEKMEDISMRQKESLLSQTLFAYEPTLQHPVKQHDELRSILKSIFATKEGNFDPNTVKFVLNRYGETAVREATDGLLQDREILFISFENSTKFILSDRFNNTLTQRAFNEKFFHQAAQFKQTLCDISSSGKGLILSQGVYSGEMAALLELISDDLIDITRIDRSFKFENYESRLIDKEHISCDIVVQCNVEGASKIAPKVTKVPFVGSCQPIWVDLNAEVNRELWTKIIIALLYHIVVKPGVTDYILYDKMHPVLSAQDYSKAMEWLSDSGCVKPTACGGYSATNCWQYVLGQ